MLFSRSIGHCRPLLWLAIFGLVTAAGCRGDSRPATVPVSGTVTLSGQPVAGAEVTFFPAAGRLATGKTDAAGRFTLATHGDQAGALLGHHKITVTKTVATNDAPYAPTKNLLPERYAMSTNSPLDVEVTAAGPNDFPLQLTP